MFLPADIILFYDNILIFDKPSVFIFDSVCLDMKCLWSAEQRAGWDGHTAEVLQRCGQLCNTSAARLKPGPFLGSVTAKVGSSHVWSLQLPTAELQSTSLCLGGLPQPDVVVPAGPPHQGRPA